MPRFLVSVSLIVLALVVARDSVARPQAHLAGMASWYGPHFEGRLMADGCRYHQRRLSAASRTIPLGTWIRVRNTENGESVVLPVRDRGPYIHGRIIDVSRAAAEKLDFVSRGVVMVSIEPLSARGFLPCD